MAATLPLDGDGDFLQNTTSPGADGLYKLTDNASGAGHTLTIEGSDASGTDENGGNIVLQPGAPTGTGASGEVRVGAEPVGNRNGVFFRKLFNVKAYGAVGDGSVDDSGAIQSAINAAEAENYGGVVYHPEGFYRVARSLILPQNTGSPIKVKVLGSGQDRSVLFLSPDAFTGAVSKTSGQSVLTRDSGSSDFNEIRVGDGVTVGGETRIVREVTDADELQIHGTWNSTATGQSLFIRRTVFRVADWAILSGQADFTSGDPTVTDIQGGTGNLPLSQFIKADADQVNAWTEITGNPTSPNDWPNGLLVNQNGDGYRGGTHADADFTIRRSGGTGLSIKDIGIILDGNLGSVHNEAHIGIDLGTMGLSVLESVTVNGADVDLLFDMGIVVRQHHNFIRYPNISFCRVGIEVSNDTPTGIAAQGETNQARIENGYINFCREAGIHIRGYQNVVYGCVFHGTGSLGQAAETDWDDVAIVIEAVEEPASNNGWANTVMACYFERWIHHVRVLEKGNGIISNFFGWTREVDGTALTDAYFDFGTDVEATTTKMGNTFNDPAAPGFGSFSNGNNANMPGDLGLSGNLRLGNDVFVEKEGASSFSLRGTGEILNIHVGDTQWLFNNAFYDGTNTKYKANGPAFAVAFLGDKIQIQSAPSGTAGNNVTWNDGLMTVKDDGQVELGTNVVCATSGKFSIGGTDFLVNEDGNVGMGTDNPKEKLSLKGSGKAVNFHMGGAQWMLSNAYFDGTDMVYQEDGNAYAVAFAGSAMQIKTAEAGNADDPVDWNDALTIGEDGRVAIGPNAPFAALDINPGTTVDDSHPLLALRGTRSSTPTGGNDGDIHVYESGSDRRLYIKINGTWRYSTLT